MLDLAGGGELVLEGLHLRAAGERAGAQQAAPRGEDLVVQRLVLRRQIEQRDHGVLTGHGDHAATSSGSARSGIGRPPS